MRRKALMIGFSFALPYHVMRCAAKAGLAVHVFGNGPSTGLRWSRFCAKYHYASFDYDIRDYDRAAKELHALCASQSFDIVFPSDDVSTRLLAAVKERIGTRISAIPSLDCFDLLNDKWNFCRLCLQNDVRVPESRLYNDVEELRRDLAAARVTPPFTLKPTNRSGAVGVHHILSEHDHGILDKIDYFPVLLQRYIKGRDVGINVLCRHGDVVAHAIQERGQRSFRLFDSADLLANVARMASAARLHGPANLDAIVEDSSGLGYILECNPRFWYTIYMSMVLGINFVEMSLEMEDGHVGGRWWSTDKFVRLNKALFLGALKPWTCSRADWRMLTYYLSDLVPYICEKKAIYNDSHVAVHHSLMGSHSSLTSYGWFREPMHS